MPCWARVCISSAFEDDLRLVVASVKVDTLIERARPRCSVVGQAEAMDLRALFDKHYASVWRLLRRLGVRFEQVDDATQEVFWVAARRLSDIEPGREHSFLYGVALRIAASELRRQRAAMPLAELEQIPFLADQRPSPEEQLSERQARAMLDEVLNRLPVDLRTVFVLHELEGLEVREIAEIEGIPVGTASSRLRRAREEFSAVARRVRGGLVTDRGDR
jgi:RNA polymerase sigma-70 factor (ECF subfamily)